MFEIGKEYWFNVECRTNCLKDTCKGKLSYIYYYPDGTIDYAFTNVEIYELEDGINSDYIYCGTCRPKAVTECDIFNTAEEAFKQAKMDFNKDADAVKNEIKTLEDLLKFPLSYTFCSDYRATNIYIEKVKEIIGIDIDK